MEIILENYINNHNLTLLNYWKGQEINAGCKTGQIRNSYCLVKNNNKDNNDKENTEYYISIVNENDDKTYVMLFNDIEKFRKIETVFYPIWYKLSNGYIGTTIRHNNKKVFRYFHQHIMDHYSNDDKTHSVDHINRNPLDNRLSNLRIINQSHQNHNQKDRDRGTNLSADFQQLKQYIPKNIYYRKQSTDAKGLTHGEHFEVEIKFTTPDNTKHRMRRKTTKSQDTQLPYKLIQAIKIKYQIIYESKPLQNYLDIFSQNDLDKYTQETKDSITSISQTYNIANCPQLLDLHNSEIKFNKKLEKLKCTHCDKLLTGKSSLNRHITTKHRTITHPHS
jgi:hypothetical protein